MAAANGGNAALQLGLEQMGILIPRELGGILKPRGIWGYYKILSVEWWREAIPRQKSQIVTNSVFWL
jgi:hypothetical protein